MNLCELKVRRYADCMIDPDKYFSALPGEKASDNTGDTEIHGIILNSIPNGCIEQVYVQDFDCEIINLKTVNCFEWMEIEKKIMNLL